MADLNNEFSGEIKILDKTGRYCPRMIFREKAYYDMLKLMASNHAKTTEFMFSVLVEKKVLNTVIVEDVFLMPNIKCSAAYCESDPDKYSEFMHQQYTFEQRHRVRVHAHSHVNMGTSPSGTDDNLFNEKFNDVDDYYVQLIINHNAQDTVNIRDKVTGVEFKRVPVYAEVGDRVINVATGAVFTKTEDANGITLTAVTIPTITDGNYEVKNGEIILTDEYTYNFKAGKVLFKCETEMLAFDSITHKITAKISKEELDAVNKDFAEKVKTSTTVGTYGGNYGGNWNYGGKSYQNSGSNWAYGKVWNYEKNDWEWPTSSKSSDNSKSVQSQIIDKSKASNSVKTMKTSFKDDDGYNITIERKYFEGDITKMTSYK